MKNLFSYKDFIGEAKKGATPVSLFKQDVENILEDMFLQAKKPTYEYDNDGFPKSVEFQVVYNDWFCKYDDELKNEFTEGVLKKREFEPSFIYDSKHKEGEDKETSKYFIKFKIKKLKIDKESLEKDEEKKRSEQFEKDSDNQLLKKLKSKKLSDANKERIMDILKDRGVEYKNPFDEDEDDMTDEDMDKAAAKAAKMKKKSLSLNEGHMSNINIIARNSEDFNDFKDNMLSEYPEIIEEFDDDTLYNMYIGNLQEKKKNGCDCGKPKTETEKSDEEKCDCDEKDKTNEGFLGKIAKVLSKEEYKKTLNYLLKSCEENCTKEKVKELLKNMVFSKITKKALEDGNLMDSLAEELYKDVKKNMDKKEAFGSEWQEKYGIKIEEEKTETCLNCIVNETLKIKKIDEIDSLTDVFNKVYEENKINIDLNTIKKFNE